MKNYDFTGEKNNYCKLSDEQVKEIFIEAKAKKSTYREIAKKYSISHSQVYKIYNSKTRKYLDLHRS